MTDFEMVVVNGIRYRPEDAPKSSASAAPAAAKKAAPAAKNKARQPEQSGGAGASGAVATKA
ncbi:hypothetical protein GS966_20040 [Rhodococcus hoagii]|nr:hypothetical protein [Prescottella equi]NKS73130.1 hypothetical protein [Prescottella equi]NKZ92218.1 hypothetical protein [Prescottella equi]